MQGSVSRFNRGSNEESSEMATCPHCGRSFACGGVVKKAEGGEVSVLGKKKDVDLPRHQLSVYRGEGVPRGTSSDDLDEDERRRLEYARAVRQKYRK